jgi:pimeloyl-ACP methyl ester carboxylesterase
VAVFLPGFNVGPSQSLALLDEVAGHGIVVVGVDLGASPLNQVSSVDDALAVPEVLSWARTDLGAVLSDDVSVSSSMPTLFAHSRGGKVAWRVVSADRNSVAALALLDPVDSDLEPNFTISITDPRAVVGSLSFSHPALILGTSKGPTGFQPCAPDGDNHEQFAAALPAATHLIGAGAGHMDIMGPNCGFSCSSFVCAQGEAPEDFRDAAAGLVVAVVRAAHGVEDAVDDAVQALPEASGIGTP